MLLQEANRENKQLKQRQMQTKMKKENVVELAARADVRTVRLSRVWISEGLTQAGS